jgi:hypothetical protein
MRTASRLRRRAQRTFAISAAGLLIVSVMPVGGAGAVPSDYVEIDGNIVKDGTGTYDWSNSGARQSTAVAQGTRYNRPTAGGVFDGGIFVNSTTVPIGPSRTTAAAADTSIAAATFKPDPLSADVSSCGTGDPTAYTGAGSEVNGGLISSDTFATASIPNKDDLSNVYALAHVGTGVNEVFFGGERISTNGDSHIDYEFLQSTVSIPVNACSGSFSGHRTLGDFLVSVDFTSGGTFGGQHIYKWVCGSVTPNATTHVCDPSKAKGGPHYEEVTDNAVLSALEVVVNSGGALDCGGWACRDSSGASVPTIPTNGLMEGAIDLQQLGFNGCISTFLPHTRSSQSFTATLKDFEVIPFNTCANPTVSTTIRTGSTGSTAATVNTNDNAVHVNIGDTLHDSADLTGEVGTPTGTYAYTLFTGLPASGNPNPCTSTSTAVGSGNFSGTIPDSDAYTFTAAGTYAFQVAVTFTDPRNQGTPKSGCREELVIVEKASPAPHSTPVVQIKDTFSVTSFSSNATGNVVVGLYTDSGCTTRAQVAGVDVPDVTKTVAQATSGAETTFVAVTAGTYYFKISYAGDANNNQFSDCTERVGVTIVPLA